MAPKIKVAITLSADVVDKIRYRVARGDVSSVSAFLQHAAQGQLAAEADFDELIDEMLASTGGPATPEERAAARRLLTGSAA